MSTPQVPSQPVDVRGYQGAYVALPEPLASQIANALWQCGEKFLSSAIYHQTTYEPDNHHNAALCPYCNQSPNGSGRSAEDPEASMFEAARSQAEGPSDD